MKKIQAFAVVDITDAPEAKVEVVYSCKKRAEAFRDKQIRYFGPRTVILIQPIDVIIEDNYAEYFIESVNSK